MRIVFSRAARGDVDRLAAFLEQQDKAAALRALDRIQNAAASLHDLADRGSQLEGSQGRRLTISFGRAAYLLDYRVDHTRETVTILRVRHSLESR